MQIDVLENDNLDNVLGTTITQSGPSFAVLMALQDEIQNMNVSNNINVQLLSKKNMLKFRSYLKELAILIQDRLSDDGKEVGESELTELVTQVLFPILCMENERLFHMKYDFLNSTNELLKERMEEALYCNDYQNCLIAMNELLEEFKTGIDHTTHVIDLEKKIDSLTYELTTTYKLHSSIELYMDIKKLIEEYKIAFHEIYSSSLNQLQIDNFHNAIKVKDTIIQKMQNHKYEEYDHLKNKRTIS